MRDFYSHFTEPSVAVPEGSTGPGGDGSRPGRLIGCRRNSYNGTSSQHPKWQGETGSNSLLPACSASEILDITFGHPEQSSIIENWVNSVVGEEDRRRIYGNTAVTRAMKSLHVKHYENNELPYSGELRRDGSQMKAFIGVRQRAGRKMFTLAHELAHAALYLLDAEIDHDHNGTERLCDLFAAELIMPAELVHEIWRKTPDARAVAGLRNTTRSSVAASCLRMAECLGDAASGLVLADGCIKKYGSDLGASLAHSVMFTFRKAPGGTSSWILPNGLTVSTHATEKLIFFVARRTS